MFTHVNSYKGSNSDSKEYNDHLAHIEQSYAYRGTSWDPHESTTLIPTTTLAVSPMASMPHAMMSIPLLDLRDFCKQKTLAGWSAIDFYGGRYHHVHGVERLIQSRPESGFTAPQIQNLDNRYEIPPLNL